MRSFHSWQRISLGLGLAALLAAVGCDGRGIYVRNWNQIGGNQRRYERTSSHEAPFPAGSTLDVDTSSGSIGVTGTDGTDCSIVATITGFAPTEEEAQELAEQVEIKLEQSNDTLRVRADQPTLPNNRGISVSYKIMVPRRANVACRSGYGSVTLAGFEGTVNGKTGSGSIEAERISGTTHLDTSYGSISCRDVTGSEIALHSGSGSIHTANLEGQTRIDSSYGSITCDGFSGGDLTVRSGSGSIAISGATFAACEVDSSYGAVTGSHLKGDTIKYHSGSGSVAIAESDAARIELSASYGRIDGRQITTRELEAHSGSGSVEIVCTPACPSDLTASVRSSYGSVTLTAPPSFAGRVTLSTSYGSVESDLPVTITGRIGDKKKIEGTVGQGNGALRLESGSGSVALR
ncbi:MAG: DUF4097 family beta strand repeat protein [Sedimentisphaerales bacterium]|nr:DUF4097 family beta strand repeat protein [Sedimentisphaerales bacterium]